MRADLARTGESTSLLVGTQDKDGEDPGLVGCSASSAKLSCVPPALVAAWISKSDILRWKMVLVLGINPPKHSEPAFLGASCANYQSELGDCLLAHWIYLHLHMLGWIRATSKEECLRIFRQRARVKSSLISPDPHALTPRAICPGNDS